jgi:hypothetical protein
MTETGPALDEATIAGLEQALGVRLPDDYREFLATTNGGRTAKSHRMFALGKSAVALQGLHRLDTPGSPLRSDGWRPPWMPRDLMSIGSASGGIVALCIDGEHRGSLWYIDLDNARPEGSNPRVAWHDRRDFTKIADNFRSFMASLTPLAP